MKKFLLTFSAVTMTAATVLAVATPVVPKHALKSEGLRHKVVKNIRDIKANPTQLNARPLTRAGQLEMDWGYCEDPFNAVQLESYTVNQAIYVTAEDAEKFAGASLNSILVGTPANIELFDEDTWTYGNDIEDVTVWLTYDLEGEHFAEMKGKFEKEAFTWTNIDLENPYIVEKDKPFYVGVTYNLNVLTDEEGEYTDDYGYVTDSMEPEYRNTNLIYTTVMDMDDDGEYIYGDKAEWRDLSYLFGNACIRINLTGENLPTDMLTISDAYIPSFVTPGDKLEVYMYVRNRGASLIDSADVCIEYQDGTKETVTASILDYNYDYDLVPSAIAYNGYGLIEVELEGPAKEGYSEYTITLPTLNGSLTNNAETSLEGMVLSLSDGYHKNNVVEEATGTWCGFCPIGYAGMEWLAKNCEENAIGIAMHYDDPMDVFGEDGAYAPFASYNESYPASFFNRNWKNDIYPSPEDLEDELWMIEGIPALTEIKASITPISEDQKTIKLDATVQFILPDEAGNYAIAYTVIEDGVGPYTQENYLSGEDPGTAYGFENMPERVRLKFNDVARNCSHPTPIEHSLPTTIVANTNYEFSTEIELSDVKNLSNYRVVPMVLNKKSGYVENTCVVKSPTYDYSEVKSLQADKTQNLSIIGGKGVITISGNTDNVRIFSADGRYVGKATGFRTSLAPGFYIVNRGNESTKVIVR